MSTDTTRQHAGPAAESRAHRTYALRLPALALLFLATGGVAYLSSGARAANVLWMLGLVVTGAPVVWRTLRGALAGHFASDVVATLAVLTALALYQPLAGLVIVLMQTGGEALERYAEGRASAALRALEDEAPRVAHRLPAAGDVAGAAGVKADDIGVAAIAVGDRLLVRPGEMLPCDAVVEVGSSHVDSSRLTGEPMPTRVAAGEAVMSGSINLDRPLVIRATATAGASQYARIVELVRSAQASKAPLQRLADRYAAWFTPATLVACAIAYLVSGDVERVLAVLVVATPCPLILATPVAIIGGVNRAARRLIVVRHGGALEQLAGVTVAVFDKTGTITVGRPMVHRVAAAAGFTEREVLALAAAVEEGSGHQLARSVGDAASTRGIALSPASGVTEVAGQGVHGVVDGRRVSVGSLVFVAGEAPRAAHDLVGGDPDGRDQAAAGLRAYVAVDDRLAGVIEFADQLRPGLRQLLTAFRRSGVRRCLLLSGDSVAHTNAIATLAGIREARGGLLPGDKVDIVRALVSEGARVVMVGDGTNDAPALSAATVGVALAGHGGGITAEAADVVILNDDLSRVLEAIHLSRRTMRIARQSIWAGIGLSAVAMVVAAAGYIPPTIGALLQEAIDVAVIMNALRTSRTPPAERVGQTGSPSNGARVITNQPGTPARPSPAVPEVVPFSR